MQPPTTHALTPGQATYVITRLLNERRLTTTDITTYLHQLHDDITAIEQRLATLRAAAPLRATRSTARNIVRIAPLRWRRRDAVDAANEQAAQLDLLGNSVLGLLRACQAALHAGEDVPADLRTAVGQLRAAVGALAEHGIGNGADAATVEPLRHLAQWPPSGEAAYTPLVTLLIRACARDVLRIHGVDEGA